MAHEPTTTDDELETLFADAREDARLDPALRTRVLTDAFAIQAATAAAVPPVVRSGRLRRWWDIGHLFGGWAPASAVMAAGVAGVTMGIIAPDTLDGWTSGQLWAVVGGAADTPDLAALWMETENAGP